MSVEFDGRILELMFSKGLDHRRPLKVRTLKKATISTQCCWFKDFEDEVREESLLKARIKRDSTYQEDFL